MFLLSTYRRLYFWRNLLRTLEETKRALNKLNSERTFREALSREPALVQEAFELAKKNLNKASDGFVRKLRNEIGAHLDQPAMQAALDEIDHRRQGFIETGDIKGKLHYRFAGELLLAVLVREAPNASQEATLEILIKDSAAIIKETWDILDDVIACYARERRLS